MPRLAAGDQRTALDRLHRILPGVPNHMFTPQIDGALEKVHDALHTIGLTEDGDRLAQIHQRLRRRHDVVPMPAGGDAPAERFERGREPGG